jgi:protein-S-isoprenylcysteine O-methyltransferase Ste14
MRRSTATVGSAVFFVVAPGVVAGLVPWLISGWQLPRPMSPLAIVRLATGVVLLALAVVVLVRAFARFVVEGGGTPAPVAPTERLVVGGEYRFVRNPMYLAVVTAVLGQAMIFGFADIAGICLCRLGDHGGVRTLVRGANAAEPLWG